MIVYNSFFATQQAASESVTITSTGVLGLGMTISWGLNVFVLGYTFTISNSDSDARSNAVTVSGSGIAGGIHALGSVGRFASGFSPGYGFTGIAVALLGRGSAVGILLAAILFGALATSGATIQLFSDVPIEIVNVLQGMVMIFAVARFGWIIARRRRAA